MSKVLVSNNGLSVVSTATTVKAPLATYGTIEVRPLNPWSQAAPGK